MGLAFETVAGFITNSAALANATPSPGDVFAVRNFPNTADAALEAVITKGGQAVIAAVKSPLFHDNVRGIQLISAQAPTQYELPAELGQPLTAQDALQVQVNSGAANSSIIALSNYYKDLPGAAARLHSWADIAGLVKSVKTIEVDCVCSAVIGTWVDTVITTTENLLHANTDYAVLGYQVDVACAVVALKGIDTGNLRVGGPGTVLQDTTNDYFVQLSDRHGRPHIPVFNSANAGNTLVSVLDNAANTAVKVFLICAELSSNLTS